MRNVAILILACLAAQHVSAARLPTIPEHDDGHDTHAIQKRTIDLGSLASLVPIVKAQFIEILQELCQQAFKYLLQEFHHYKLHLLKKLGKYTLSDVFHTVFDGVTDFVIIDEAEEASTTTEADEEEQSETNQFDLSYLDPYGWKEVMAAQESRPRRS